MRSRRLVWAATVVGAAAAPVAIGAMHQASQNAYLESAKAELTESPARVVPGAGVRLDGDYRFGDGIAFQNLTVWPVFLDLNRDVGEFLTLTEAGTRNVMEIRERGGGTVAQIEIVNRAPVPILACAGTLIRGGKQDRVIADDVVVPPRSTLAVRVYCVERGRWQDVRVGVDWKGKFVPADCKATKRVRVNAQYQGNQSEVWNQTRAVKRAILETTGASVGRQGSQYYLSSTVTSGTGSYFNAIDHADVLAQATRRRMAAVAERHLRATKQRPVGFAYAIDGEPVSVRTFADPRLFERRMHSFLRTMCLEAEVARRCHTRAGRAIHDDPASIEAVVAMVRGLREAEPEVRELSPDCRVSTRRNGFGGSSACSIRVERPDGTYWVELTRDWTAPLVYGQEALEVMAKLGALGYTR